MAKKVKIEDDLYNRIKNVAEIGGYSSPEEFILHIIERELLSLEEGGESEEEIQKRLQGLGYIS
jgi:predicted CopG family antitoxin